MQLTSKKSKAASKNRKLAKNHQIIDQKKPHQTSRNYITHFFNKAQLFCNICHTLMIFSL